MNHAMSRLLALVKPATGASLAGLTVATILFLFFPYPQPIEIGLDPSWRFALSDLADREIFGRIPIVFTYGYLGYLIRGAATNATFLPIMIFRGLVHFFYIFIAFIYFVQIEGTLKRGLFVSALGFPALLSLYKPFFQTEFQLAIIPALILALPRVGSIRPWKIVALSIFSGFLFHTKTSLVYYSLPPLILYIIGSDASSVPSGKSNIPCRMASRLLLCGLVFASSVFLFGNANSFDSLQYLSQITSGYSSGMSRAGPLLETFSGLLLLGLGFAISLLLLNNRSRNIGLFLALNFLLLIAFKHGFVRQGHAPRFFVLQPIICTLILSQPSIQVFIRHKLRPSFALAVWLASAAIGYLAVIGKVARSPGAVKDLSRSIQNLRSPFSISSRLEQQSRINLRQVELPLSLVNKIGSDSVDIVPRELSVMAANELNWHPRPTLQSYQGYTQGLDLLNAKHIYMDGPKSLIVHYDSIDQKNQAFYSPAEWLAIVCNYSFASSYDHSSLGEIVLLRRRTSSQCFKSKPSAFKRVAWSAPVAIGEIKTDDILVVGISIKYNMLGKLLELLFRGPPIYIDLGYEDGENTSYRFTHNNSANGLLLSPLATNMHELPCVFRLDHESCLRKRLKHVSLKTSWPWLYRQSIVIELSRLSIMPNSGQKQSRGLSKRIPD